MSATVPGGWRAARVTLLGELHTPPRMTAALLRLVVQVVLVASLWRGLYATTGTTAGLTRDQAVTYAVLAVLATRIRALDQYSGRDTVQQHMHFGTIVYWYLRPLPRSATTRCGRSANNSTDSSGRRPDTRRVWPPGSCGRPGRRPWRRCSG